MLRFVLWVAEASLVIAFLAGYAARYVHPRHAWWLQGFAVGLPVLALVVAATTVGHALFRQYVAALGFLALLLLLLPRYTGWTARAGEGEAMGVLSFNADATYFGGEGEADLEGVLRRHAPSVVALQEASFVGFRSGEIVATTPGYRPLAVHPTLDAPPSELDEEGGRRLPVFVEGSWVSFEEVEIADRNDDKRGPRSTLSRARFVWQGDTISVYNVHLRSFGRHRPWRQRQQHRLLSLGAWREAFATYRGDFEARANDAERLRAVLDAEPHPYLLCGDLNSTPHHWAYAHLAEGMRDAFQIGGRGWGGTYHAQLPLVRIDYVLASSQWGVVRARVPRGLASDHRPVLAWLVLRQGELGAGV